MPKSVLKSPTGSNHPTTTVGHTPSSPKTGMDSTLKLKIGSKAHTEKSHDKTKIIGGIKFSTVQCQPIFDESGIDVTPHPLEKRSFVDIPKTTSALMGAIDAPSTILEHAGRSKFMSMRASVVSMMESLLDDEQSIYSPTREPSIVQPQHEILEEPSSQDTLILPILPPETHLTIVLTETPTIFHLDIEGYRVQTMTELEEIVEMKNERYRQLCKVKETSDIYTSRPMQTFNFWPKIKGTQTNPIVTKEVGTQVTLWQLFDAYQESEKSSEEEEAHSEKSDVDASAALLEAHSIESIIEIFKDGISDGGGDATLNSGQKQSPQNSSIPTPQSTSSRFYRIDAPELIDAGYATTRRPLHIIKSQSLKKNLFLMDRMISLNLFQKKLATYKGLKILEASEEVVKKPEVIVFYDEDEGSEDKSLQEKPSYSIADIVTLEQTKSIVHVEIENAYCLNVLWSFFSPLLIGYSVNCLAINPTRDDLFAIGYGDLDFRSARPGYACCWSLKNLRHPERIFECKHGVTSIAFSNKNPALLTVGLHDGTCMLSSVQEQTNEWIMDSSDCHELQIGPIWKLVWVSRRQGLTEEKREVLISACEDGQVCQWFLRKGMEPVVLMRVKMSSMSKKEKMGDISVAKYATIFCMDFHPTRENIYLIGTGDGNIYECSCTNSDHFVATYVGHTNPVYKVAWSPFAEEIFVSCSADWTMRLWMVGEPTCLMILQSVQSTVVDVCWSPTHAMVLAAIHSEQVEVWDLDTSVLDPTSVFAPTMEAEFTLIAFTQLGDAMMIGDSVGRLTMVMIRNFPPPAENQREMLLDLVKAPGGTREM